jgi:Flp pilus assembly protein TadD
MAAVKVGIAITDGIIASILCYRLAIVPYQQNLCKKRVQNMLLHMIDAPATGISAKIRETIQQTQRALRNSPTDIDLYMELAAQYRFIGRPNEAVKTYRDALRYDRRPEIYRNLAESQLAIGNISGAEESYAHAVAFAPEQINIVPDALAGSVTQQAKALTERIAR